VLRGVANLVRTMIGFPIIALATIVLGLVIMVGEVVAPRSLLADRMARLWSRIALQVAGVRYQIEGSDRVKTRTGYVVISNHIGNLDPMLNFLALPNARLRFMAKREVYKIPILAQALHSMHMVKVDRSAGREGFEEVNRQVGEVFERGLSLIVYAEGTRSRTSEMGPFKKGGFLLAIRHQAAVVPVTIIGTNQSWVPGEWLLRGGGKARAVVHEPIPTNGLTEADADALKQKVRDIIESTYLRLQAEASAAASAG